MKRLIQTAIMLVTAVAMTAQTTLLRLHSEAYDLYGSGSQITLALGSVASGTVMVTSGGISRECQIAPAVYNQATQRIDATYITCELDATGIVEITTTQSRQALDYINGDGCAITEIEVGYPSLVDVLSLRHNSLHALDMTAMTGATSIDVGDNPFDVSPCVVGPDKPNLAILTLDMVGALDEQFTLTDYPSLVVFEAYGTPSLTQCDPSQCPGLMKLTIDGTSVQTLDVTSNPQLLVLNVSESGVSSLDLSNCPNLQELYCEHRSSSINVGKCFTELDVSHCPQLKYLFCSGNKLETLDVSYNPQLQDLYCRDNLLTTLDLSHNPMLLNVMVTGNYMNFNTLPVNPGTWMEYECRQRPMPVPRSYLIGSEIDMAAAVVRSDSPTYCSVLRVDPMDPAAVNEVDAALYTYADGVVTITGEVADSVYVSFYNPLFPDIDLRTTTFKVKTAATYGQDDLAFTLNVPMLSTSDRVRLSIGMSGATEQTPKTFYVDMGDGTKRPFTATTVGLPDAPNVDVVKMANGLVTVYMPQDELVTAVGFADSYVADINLANLEGLRHLSLTNTEMYGIDLSRNRYLESLTLTGNHFGASLTLAGLNGGYEKYLLTDINLSNNEMTAVGINTIEIVERLDLSHNQLTTLDFTDAEYITDLDVSDNKFETLKINYLSSLKRLNASDNQLSQIIMPETNVIEWMDVRGNRFTLANIPPHGQVAEDDYLYAPQSPIGIPTTGPGCNLSSQCVTIDGHTTTFAWFTTQDEPLTEGIDYLISDGRTSFLAPSIGREVYCTVSNAAYPAFSGDNALRTTAMTAMGLPDYVIGEFTTLDERQAQLSLAAREPNTSIYIDWAGDGTLEEYVLGTSYQLFTAQTVKDARVKIYSYDAVNNLSVFSMEAGRLADVDLTEMRQLGCLSLTNAGLSELAMPQSATLSELYLAGGNFTVFDFAAYPSLRYVIFDGNKFESVDLSGLDKIESVSFAHNRLTDVTFGGNANLWAIYLSDNRLTEIDLSECPSAYQVALNHNELSHIDVDGLTDLRVLYIDNNCFDYNTLPHPRSQWTLYVYGNQRPIEAIPVDGVVDLSSQAWVDDVATVYTWIVGEPWYDESAGAYMADVLIEGEDYEIEGGVTRFLLPCYEVSCLMYNEVYPQMTLTTTTFDIDELSVSAIKGDALHVIVNGRDIMVVARPGVSVAAYGVDGRMLSRTVADSNGHATLRSLPKGVAVITIGDASTKVNIR